MSALAAHRRRTCWLAALAILLAVLAPSVSQALGVIHQPAWVEVCTTQGSKWVQPGAQDDGPAGSVQHLLEHCPYCCVHTPALGLPPSPVPVPRLIDARHEVPPAFLAAPRTLHAWVSAQPRAPPARA